MSLHFQRSWPIVTTSGTWVARHTHASADLSAVYWVNSPPDSGKLTLWDPSPRNECAPGLNGRDGEIVKPNPLNYDSVSYEPKEGRLVLFPAKTPHSVEAGDIDGLRVSLTCDVTLTTREDEDRPFYEFLLPSPTTWRKFAPMSSYVEEESATLPDVDT